MISYLLLPLYARQSLVKKLGETGSHLDVINKIRITLSIRIRSPVVRSASPHFSYWQITKLEGDIL